MDARRAPHRRWPPLAAWVVLLYACSSPPKPDLERLYRQMEGAGQPPVILIHGILGARLTDTETGVEAWFGNLGRLAFSDYRELALEIDSQTLKPLPSTLTPTGLTDRVAGRDYYGNIIEVLETAGGYQRATPGQTQSGDHRRYYVFTYDWRLDNVTTARRLDELIQQVQHDHGDPGLKVDLVAHSMGGLVARYYLRYGRTDVLDDNEFPVNHAGAGNVRRTLLLGTPNLGSISSLHAFITGYRIGLRGIPTEVLATMPSLYQLFPHSLKEWLVTVEGEPLQRDLFDVRIWRRFQWSIFDPEVRERILSRGDDAGERRAYLGVLEAYFEKQLERARRFVWSLTVPVPDAPYRLVVFGGDCQLTPARLLVEEVEDVSEIRLWPHKITKPLPHVNYDMLLLEPGDGTVTKASLLAREHLDPTVRRHRYIDFPLDYPLFVCEHHERLTGNPTFLDNLLHHLLHNDPRR